MAECRKCQYYEHRAKTRTGFCRNEKSKYYGLIVYGRKPAANYCFIIRNQPKNGVDTK